MSTNMSLEEIARMSHTKQVVHPNKNFPNCEKIIWQGARSTCPSKDKQLLFVRATTDAYNGLNEVEKERLDEVISETHCVKNFGTVSALELIAKVGIFLNYCEKHGIK